MKVLFFQPVFGSGDFHSINRIHIVLTSRRLLLLGWTWASSKPQKTAAQLGDSILFHVKPEKVGVKWYCWCFRNPAITTQHVWNPVNNGYIYHINWRRMSEPSTISFGHLRQIESIRVRMPIFGRHEKSHPSKQLFMEVVTGAPKSS